MDVWNSVLSLFMEGYKESFSPLFAAFVKVGGYENLVSGYFEATASVQAFKVPGDNSSGLCGAVPQDAMHLFRSNVPGESDLPWTGVIFIQTFSFLFHPFKNGKKVLNCVDLHGLRGRSRSLLKICGSNTFERVF